VLAALEAAAANGVPTLPGYDEADQSDRTLTSAPKRSERHCS